MKESRREAQELTRKQSNSKKETDDLKEREFQTIKHGNKEEINVLCNNPQRVIFLGKFYLRVSREILKCWNRDLG